MFGITDARQQMPSGLTGSPRKGAGLLPGRVRCGAPRIGRWGASGIPGVRERAEFWAQRALR